MIINTHLLFSRIIYKHCLKKLDFKLHKSTFLYGSIKPDIFCNHSKESHTLDETINIVSEYSDELINNESNIKQFSMTLGVICHYICDYFCLYHSEEYSNKNIFKHLIYEIILHISLLILIIRGKLKFVNNRNLPQRNILSIIFHMQKRYFQKRKSFLRDITYALSTITWVTESIIYFSINKSKNYAENKAEIYELPKAIDRIV
ncbi:zinc dependent phospholipase C family protein [Clostridium sp. DJ247]|uniref:zinc dependent phospholipase C family protein n=1 Tax=Clostridium sp. DJ247 TaxID=2726188 RepID=UPI001626DA13|nr:zinc dependent phospholipase C family protein [Clostridium sp. DJ247]